MLLPVDMREWLPEDDLVYVVLDAVAALDLGEFRRRYRADVTKMLPWSYGLLAIVFVFFSASLWLDLFHPVGG